MVLGTVRCASSVSPEILTLRECRFTSLGLFRSQYVERKVLGEKRNGVAVLAVESQSSGCALSRILLRTPPRGTSHLQKDSEWSEL